MDELFELFFELIVIIIGVCILAVISGIAASIVAGIAGLVGVFFAVLNYVSAIRHNLDFRHWEWERGDEPARRSYFFGPGYVQLFATIRNAFELNAASGKRIREIGRQFRGSSLDTWGKIRNAGSYIFTAAGFICVYAAGLVLCGVLGLIHGTITTAVMILTYIVFTIVWITDHVYLLKNKIFSDCPICKNRFLIPLFKCPDCGKIHKKLVPGPYGIWNHTCVCGTKIPSTFLNGRSRLEAYCPCCTSPLAASDARPIVFQLIGGTKAGKTVYLSAFFHEYLKRLTDNPNLKLTITDQYRPYFDELEQWYNGADCPATAQLNSQMYPVLIDSPLGIRRQFSIYDIAGEMFNGVTADSQIPQRQFHYCDGLLFLIDPFSSGVLRTKKINAGEDISSFSDIAAEDVAANFINYLIRTGHANANERCSIPIAVLIAKADVEEVAQAIGPAKINSVFRSSTGQYGTYENARDQVCRQFLLDIGLTSAVDNLETQFSNLHYFPVSAIGHSANGTPYEPCGIMDAIEWMLPLADQDFAGLTARTAAKVFP